MSKRTARIELAPAEPSPSDLELKPSARPHFLRLVAANGEILAHSENYSSRANARRASGAWVQAFRDVLATPATERVTEVSK
jgi:hypothetical protein